MVAALRLLPWARAIRATSSRAATRRARNSGDERIGPIGNRVTAPSDPHMMNKNFSHIATSISRGIWQRSEEHTSELQSLRHLVCRLLLEKKKKIINKPKIQAI